MSLYYEAASFIEESQANHVSIKSQIFKKNGLKSKPTHIWALICKASLWSSVLGDVIDKAGLLSKEGKLSPSLALLLTYDLLLSPSGVAAPIKHVLRLTITRHKARLNAEFVRARIRAGFASIQEWLIHLEEGSIAEESSSSRYPRWVRTNLLRSSVDHELTTTFTGYIRAKSLEEVLTASAGSRVLYLDDHIPDLIALPPGSDWSKSEAYRDGRIIFQDKASCFPAYFLDFEPSNGICIDACAAPGNKTSHLAALAKYKQALNSPSAELSDRTCIVACERDPARATVLQAMLKTAGAIPWVQCLPGQDFLKLDPSDSQWTNVSALLLDPSCSGSGIVGRENDNFLSRLVLPSKNNISNPSVRAGSKRKRFDQELQKPDDTKLPIDQTKIAKDYGKEENQFGDAAQKLRLKQLSDFQTTILMHAMRFSGATKISYSTCSIHEEENEFVVLRALRSPVAMQRGWRIWKRQDQVEGMKKWPYRGSLNSCKRGTEDYSYFYIDSGQAGNPNKECLQQIAEACIRCDKGSTTGTIGFFVAGFVRDGDEAMEVESWDGFSDGSEG